MPEGSTSPAGSVHDDVDERTALLQANPEGAPETVRHADAEEAAVPDASARDERSGRFLTMTVTIALVVAAITVAYCVGIKVALVFKPRSFHLPYDIDNYYGALGVMALLAAFSSAMNLVRHRRNRAVDYWSTVSFFTVLFDLVLVVFMFSALPRMLDELDRWYWRAGCYSSDDPPGAAACDDFRRNMQVVLWFYMGLAIVLTVLHIILLVGRWVAAYRVRALPRESNRRFRFSLPSGEFTVAVTVKYLRLDRDAEAGRDSRDSRDGERE